MAPSNLNDQIIWFTAARQITKIKEIVVPILKSLALNLAKNEGCGLCVIVRLEGEEKRSLRFQYGILFSVYQKVTLYASEIDPKLTATLDLRVFLEHLCDTERVTNHFTAPIKFIIDGSSNYPALEKPNISFERFEISSDSVIFVPESPLLGSIPDETFYNSVALGGTFDHLHSGHKLMLSLASLLTADRLLCGITASEMLKTKNHPEKLETLDNRMLTVQDFLMNFRSGCERKVEIVTLRDAFGPTIELDDLEALIVSPETLPGGLKSNN